MSQTATIRSLPQAFEIIKEMRAEGYEWREDYRGTGHEVLAEIVGERMKPKPGLYPAVGKALGIDLERSGLIGDTLRDIAAGKDVGCATTGLVLAGHGRSEQERLMAPTIRAVSPRESSLGRAEDSRAYGL